jgi:hypothetical protein
MVDKLVAQGEAMAKAKQIIDSKNQKLPYDQQIPYPPDMINYLNQTLVLRQQFAAAQMAEGQADMMKQQADAMTPAGQVGALPPPPPPGGSPGMVSGPPPEGPPPGGADAPQNRARPEISDEMRADAPRVARRIVRQGDNGEAEVIELPSRRRSFMEIGPSSYGHKFSVSEEDAQRAVGRRQHTAAVADLVEDPGFYQMLNMPQYEGQIRADFADIAAGKAGDSESSGLLNEMLERYEDLTGVQPQW